MSFTNAVVTVIIRFWNAVITGDKSTSTDITLEIPLTKDPVASVTLLSTFSAFLIKDVVASDVAASTVLVWALSIVLLNLIRLNLVLDPSAWAISATTPTDADTAGIIPERTAGEGRRVATPVPTMLATGAIRLIIAELGDMVVVPLPDMDAEGLLNEASAGLGDTVAAPLPEIVCAGIVPVITAVFGVNDVSPVPTIDIVGIIPLKDTGLGVNKED